MTTKKNLLLVGVMTTRPSIVSETMRVATAIDANVFVLTKSADPTLTTLCSNVLVYDIDDHSLDGIRAVVDCVQAHAQTLGVSFDIVYTCLNAYAELTAYLCEAFGTRGNPPVAVHRAHNKGLARAALMQDPATAVPHQLTDSPNEARNLVARLGGEWVAKPARGAGGRGVISRVTNPNEAADAWCEIRHYLDRWQDRPDAGQHLLDGTVAVLFERRLKGFEVDVELVLQSGRVIFAAVADNPYIELPNRIETSSTYPSQLPEHDQTELIEAAKKVLDILELHHGNFHVELVLTSDGIRPIEVNARMGGAFVWESIREVYGISLIELGIRALLPERLPQIHTEPSCVLESRFLIPSVSGTLKAVRGLERMRTADGLAHVNLWKEIGDTVNAPGNEAIGYLGFASFAGDDRQTAIAHADHAMGRLSFVIATPDGTLTESKGTFLHGD